MSRKKRRKQRTEPQAPAAPSPEPETPRPDWAASAARVLVGAVLLTAGLMKASAPAEEFAAVIEAYHLPIPPQLTLKAAVALPWALLLGGLAMVAGYLCRAACLAAMSLLLVFIAALASVLARGIPLHDCGCFGWDIGMAPSHTIWLDILLLGLAYFVYRRGGAGAFAPLDHWIERGH